MTTTTLSFSPIASPSRAPRVGTARVDHWFKPAAKAKAERQQRSTDQRWSTALPTSDEMSMARIDHWFRQHAMAAQWRGHAPQHDDPLVARMTQLYQQHALQSPSAAPRRASRLRAWWRTQRERHALARAEAELRTLAGEDPRVLRELQVARDLAEWNS